MHMKDYYLIRANYSRIQDFVQHSDERIQIIGSIIQYYRDEFIKKHGIIISNFDMKLSIYNAFRFIDTYEGASFWTDIHRNGIRESEVDALLEILSKYHISVLEMLENKRLKKLSNNIEKIINMLENENS